MEMEEQFRLTLYWTCDYLSIIQLTLLIVGQRAAGARGDNSPVARKVCILYFNKDNRVIMQRNILLKDSYT